MIVLYLMMGKYLGMTVKGLYLCYTWWSTWGWMWKGSICFYIQKHWEPFHFHPSYYRHAWERTHWLFEYL